MLKENNLILKKDRGKEFFNVGNRISAQKVLCIDDTNKNHGVIPIQEALSLAKQKGLDLVEISKTSDKNVPICKIVEFSKFKYDQAKREKEAKKKQRLNSIKVKEIRFKPSTCENDLRIKAKQAQEFINDGHKVKVSILFKGRELSHQDIGKEKFNLFFNMIENAAIDGNLELSGKQITAVLFKHVQEKAAELG